MGLSADGAGPEENEHDEQAAPDFEVFQPWTGCVVSRSRCARNAAGICAEHGRDADEFFESAPAGRNCVEAEPEQGAARPEHHGDGQRQPGDAERNRADPEAMAGSRNHHRERARGADDSEQPDDCGPEYEQPDAGAACARYAAAPGASHAADSFQHDERERQSAATAAGSGKPEQPGLWTAVATAASRVPGQGLFVTVLRRRVRSAELHPLQHPERHCSAAATA